MIEFTLSDADDRNRIRNEDLKRAEEQMKLDLEYVMADARGRRVMRAIVASTGVFRSSYTGNSETFYREGRREVGLWLLNLITRAAPDYVYEVLTGEKR